MFFPGDRVRYIGQKFSKELGNKVGEVFWRVHNDDSLVVDFGDDSFVVPVASLEKYNASQEPSKGGLEITIRRSRRLDEDEEEKK